MNETDKDRIERIINGGHPVEIGLLKKEIEIKIENSINELSHYEFYLVKREHLKNCTLCRSKLDQDKGKKK